MPCGNRGQDVSAKVVLRRHPREKHEKQLIRALASAFKEPLAQTVGTTGVTKPTRQSEFPDNPAELLLHQTRHSYSGRGTLDCLRTFPSQSRVDHLGQY